LPKLVEGLKRLSKSDPMVQVSIVWEIKLSKKRKSYSGVDSIPSRLI
jgi:hypothetical protein